MTQILKPFIRVFVVVYFDDILIYSRSRDIHICHLRQVCAVFRKERLYANFKKCIFMIDHLVFLRFIVSSSRVSTDPEKVKAIVHWPEPKNIHDVRSFHGLATFYHRFIHGFNTITTPITNCIRKGTFIWTKTAALAFQNIKEKMTQAPVL